MHTVSVIRMCGGGRYGDSPRMAPFATTSSRILLMILLRAHISPATAAAGYHHSTIIVVVVATVDRSHSNNVLGYCSVWELGGEP